MTRSSTALAVAFVVGCGGPPAPGIEPASGSPPRDMRQATVSVHRVSIPASINQRRMDTITALALDLHDDDASVRAAAIEALAEIGGNAAAGALTTAIDDPDPDLREEALYALAAIGGPTAEALLQQALADPDPLVAHAATRLLRAHQARSAPLSASTARVAGVEDGYFSAKVQFGN